MNKLHRLLICLAPLALSACALLPQPDVYPPSVTKPTIQPEVPTGAARYAFERAELVIHTYRAGWLKSRAHNHVMMTDRVGGSLYLTDPIEQSAAHLYFRPWDLVLDDPAARAAAGPGFESIRTPDDIAATRARMLGPKGFDSNVHPFVIAEIRWLSDVQVAVTLLFRGNRYPVEVPVTWTTVGNRIQVHADFELSHRDLDLAPYSVFAGAIGVADPIRIQLTLSATRAGSV